MLVEMQKVFFTVVGMYCISCRSIGEKQLKDTSEAKRIDIDYMTDSAIVEFDS
jgi:copper chaperone